MAKKNEEKKSLVSLDMAAIAQAAVENIEQELMSDNVSMVRDYIKGAYKLKFELEKELERISKTIKNIEEAVSAAKEGNLDLVKEIDVPVEFLEEKTVRMSRRDWRE